MVVLIGIAALVATVALGACCKSRSWLVYFDSLAGVETGSLEAPAPASEDIEYHEVVAEAVAHNVAL